MKLHVRRLVSSVARLGLLACLASTAFAQADSQVGTWTLNVAKSKYSPGPGPKSGTTKVEAAGKGTKVTVDQVRADGTKAHWEDVHGVG